MRHLSNFEYMWSKWIVPLIDDLYNQMDNRFKKYCNVQIRDLDRIAIKAEAFYQKKREEAKRTFYGEYHKGDSAIETEHRMDFHKLSSIICRTLIEYKVYDFDEECCREYADKYISPYDTDWFVRNALINFRLAFHGSVVFLFRSMQFDYYENDKILFNLIKDKDSLNLYDSNTSKSNGLNQDKIDRVKESFENCIILDLAKRDIGNHSFDYFMYAIIMYQLEEHNKYLLLAEQSLDSFNDKDLKDDSVETSPIENIE